MAKQSYEPGSVVVASAHNPIALLKINPHLAQLIYLAPRADWIASSLRSSR